MKSNLPSVYSKVLNELKEKIRRARVKAALTVNADLLYLYWEIGSIIAQQEKSQGWGAKIVERLAKDLNSEFSDMQGLSVRNLRYMRDFFEAYPQFSILQAPLAKTEKPITQAALAKLPSQIVQSPLAQITSIV